MEYLVPKFREDELICMDAPTGQLPYTATAEQVADRIIKIDEAGEDCRQKLGVVRQKMKNAEAEAAAANKKK